MSSSESEDSDNDQNNKPDFNALILSDTSLRNVYQLGYNSRSLTKNILNSINFQNVINTIRAYSSSNEATIRSFGPLILGLVRIYDKKIKLLLEEVNSLTNTKQTVQQPQDKKEDKRKALLSKKKLESKKDNRNDTNANSNNALLAISPMKEGVFSLMNNYSKEILITPSKQMTSDFISQQDSKEILRATRIQQSSLSKQMLSSNKKNTENQIQNPELHLSDHNLPELNNFFDFINDGNESLNTNNFALNLNLSANDKERSNLKDYSGSISQLKNVSFKEIEQGLKEKTKPIPYSKRNAKLDYDEDEMEINLHPDTDINVTESINELTRKLRRQMQISTINNIDQFNDIKYEYLFPDLDKERRIMEEEIKIEESAKKSKKKKSFLSEDLMKSSHSLLSEKKRISVDSFDLDSTTLMQTLTTLSLDKKDFSNIMSFNEKLEQIKEDVKEKEDVSIDNKEFNEQIDFDMNNYHQFEENKEINANEDINYDDNNNKPNIIELSSEMKKTLLKKKKPILFNDLPNKLNIKYNTKSELFYDILSLAQKGEFHLYQNTIFDNNTITISK